MSTDNRDNLKIVTSLAQTAGVPAKELWQEIEDGLVSYPTDALSQYLVELSTRLEAGGGDDAFAYFDTRIKSAAIMLQTHEGKALALEQENQALRQQIDTFPDVEELTRRNTNQKYTIEEQIKDIALLQQQNKEQQAIIERQEKVIKVAHIPEDPELVARIEQDKAVADAIGYVSRQTDKNEYLICIRDIGHPLNDAQFLVFTKESALWEIQKISAAHDEYKSLANERADKIKRLREESESWRARVAELKMEIERKDHAIESQKNSIKIQMEALQEVKSEFKDLCVGTTALLGAEYTSKPAEILDVMQRTFDGLTKDIGLAKLNAELDRPVPNILVIDDPHAPREVHLKLTDAERLDLLKLLLKLSIGA